MARNKHIVRELTLLQLLDCRYGRTIEDLAAALAVTTRTIRRDIEALEEAGLPVVDVMTEDGRRWRVLNWRKEAA